jgi:hypothetical protein
MIGAAIAYVIITTGTGSSVVQNIASGITGQPAPMPQNATGVIVR